jgi:2,3-bisphosphoglycerate-independent phosphoglycerate mutase
VLIGRPIVDALPTGDGSDILWKLMDASFQILRDHPLNDERLKAGQKPANCLWLWGQGRAILWPSLSERFKMSGVVISQSDVHRGLGIMAGLGAVDVARLASSTDLRTQAAVALDELKKKDFAYVHVELPDEVIFGQDVAAKVKGIEAVDRELVGPLLEGLAKLGSHRIVALCDSGSVHHGPAEGPGFFAYYDSAAPLSSGTGRKFIEADARASSVPPRDATKFVVRLFAKGS